MSLRLPLLRLAIPCLLLPSCNPTDEDEAAATPPTEVTDPDGPSAEPAPSRPVTPASRVRDARFPLPSLLTGGQPALNAALREYPYLDATAVIAALKERPRPTWNELLSSFSTTGSCEWDSDLLPIGHGLAASHDQVSCLIPTHEEAATADRREDLVFKGPVLDFLVSRDGTSVALVTDETGTALNDKFSRDLAKARLAIEWLFATDASWRQAETEGRAALDAQLGALTERRSQLRPLIEGIRSYQDQFEGRRPANVQQLALRGHLVSPALASWDHLDDQGNPTSTPILYFNDPPLLIQSEKRSMAVILAAPVDNDDNTRTVGTAGGEILDLPADLVAEAIAGHAP